MAVFNTKTVLTGVCLQLVRIVKRELYSYTYNVSGQLESING